MEKVVNFTQFEQKNTHTSLCIIVYLCTIATVTMHICTVTVACAFIIFIIFRSHVFFSLFSVHNKLSVFSSSFSSDAHKHTHTHADKSTHKHTHTQTNSHRQTNREIDRCLSGTIGACGWERRYWRGLLKSVRLNGAVEKAIDGEQSRSMGQEKDPGGWIGKRVVELGSWIDRLGW